MEVSVSSRNVELSEALRAVAREKIGRLDRFLDGMERAEVHFSEERNPRIANREVCEVTLEGHGHHVRAKVAATDSFAAVDAAVEKLEHQLHKLKTRLVDRKHPRRRVPVAAGTLDELAPDLLDRTAAVDGEAAPAVESDGVDAPLVADPALRIVRTKRHEMRPMAPEEAALQMDLLGHDFFFFANAETGRSGVVYRRAAGDIGLIDEA